MHSIMAHHDITSSNIIPIIGTILLIILGIAYFWAVKKFTKRWPVFQSISWGMALFICWLCLFGSLSVFGLTFFDFTSHMVNHLLLVMVAPILVIFAKPIKLLLKAMPTSFARRLTRFFHHKIIGFVQHPVLLVLIYSCGMWLLYTTSLYSWMHGNIWMFLFVHIHLFITSYFFTNSIILIDFYGKKATLLVRSGVLFFSVAIHAMLAKNIYANPPMHVETVDAELGSMLMFYGGDLVHVWLIILLCIEWNKKRRTKWGTVFEKMFLTK